MQTKKERRNTSNSFLLSFFDKEGYEEKEVNGFWLIKSKNGNTGKYQVALYSKESYENYKNCNKLF